MTALKHSGTYALPVVKRLPPEALVEYAPAVVKFLDDSFSVMRKHAVEALGKLPPEALVKYETAIEKLLEDDEKDVREAAAQVLHKLS